MQNFSVCCFYWVLHKALSNAFSWTEYFVLKYIFRNLFPQSHLKIDLNSSNINTKQLTNHYLNQWWQSYLSHTCIDVLCCMERLSCREIKKWLKFSASLTVFSINRTFTPGKRPGTCYATIVSLWERYSWNCIHVYRNTILRAPSNVMQIWWELIFIRIDTLLLHILTFNLPNESLNTK